MALACSRTRLLEPEPLSPQLTFLLMSSEDHKEVKEKHPGEVGELGKKMKVKSKGKYVESKDSF